MSWGHKQQESTFIWEDNKAAILIAENECSSAGRSQHIDVRFKFVAQAEVEGAVRVRYTPTDLNLADLLTKALPADTFERLRRLCVCLLYTSPSPRDRQKSRMPSSA